jgi:hypothetical protein
MKRTHKTFARLILIMACLIPFAYASAEEPALDEALTSGKAHVALRYRYEHVNQDNALKDANASTVRIRLNYKTADWSNWM